MVKKIAILGCTGSIGRSALSLVDLYPDRFEIVALAARGCSETLKSQCRKYRPRLVALADHQAARELARELPDCRVAKGEEGLCEVATFDGADMVLSAVTGSAGLVPTYQAVRQGKPVALANKESMVMAGDLLIPLAASRNVPIIPVDSEHSALHQCLQGAPPEAVGRIILTASGGPFREHSPEALAKVTVEEALDHPTWDMGPKITIDSATLMNKGLEVIEAHHFFGIDGSRIDVVVHPQSVVHSMVEFVDGTVLAQMSITDMRSSLLYAFAHPERWRSRLPCFDLKTLPALTFHEPDRARFPCLSLAYQALDAGGTAPTVLNAANEVAVELFLSRKLPFSLIPAVIEQVLGKHASRRVESLEQLLDIDGEARSHGREMAAGLTVSWGHK